MRAYLSWQYSGIVCKCVILKYLVKKAKLCDDSEINSLFKKCKMITETMVASEKIPDIPNEIR